MMEYGGHMFHHHADGSIYWNNEQVLAGKSGLTTITLPTDVPVGAVFWSEGEGWVEKKCGGDWVKWSNEDQTKLTHNGKTYAVKPTADEVKVELDKRTAQVNRNFKILATRIKGLNVAARDYCDEVTVILGEVRELFRENNEQKNKIECLEWAVESLGKKIDRLEATKIDRPSVSQELIDAERYVSDLSELHKKYQIERFARKQKIAEKLKSIKEANQPKKTEEEIDEEWLKSNELYMGIFILIACVVVMLAPLALTALS